MFFVIDEDEAAVFVGIGDDAADGVFIDVYIFFVGGGIAKLAEAALGMDGGHTRAAEEGEVVFFVGDSFEGLVGFGLGHIILGGDFEATVEAIVVAIFG